MKLISKLAPGFIAGLLTTLVTTFIHADRIKIAGQPIYFGIVFAAVLLVTIQRLVMSRYQNRVSGIAFAVAWLVVTIRMAIPTTDGDLALGANWFTTVYLGISALILSMSSVIRPRANSAAIE